MKLSLLCSLILLFLVACDSPRYQQRFPGGSQSFSSSSGESEYDYSGEWPEYDYGKDVPEEISHCNWDEHTYTSPHLGGEYTICQSKKSEVNFFVKLSNVEADEKGSPLKICFFPVHIVDGETTLLGESACQRIGNEAIHRVILSKSSSDSPAVNAVMVIKDKLYNFERPYPYYGVKGPWAFVKCMEQLKQGHGDYCQSFREKGEYLSHQF